MERGPSHRRNEIKSFLRCWPKPFIVMLALVSFPVYLLLNVFVGAMKEGGECISYWRSEFRTIRKLESVREYKERSR